MVEPINTILDGKWILIFKSRTENVPIVYTNMYMEMGRVVLSECRKPGCKPFHLVSILSLRWDEELSQWLRLYLFSAEIYSICPYCCGGFGINERFHRTVGDWYHQRQSRNCKNGGFI